MRGIKASRTPLSCARALPCLTFSARARRQCLWTQIRTRVCFRQTSCGRCVVLWAHLSLALDASQVAPLPSGVPAAATRVSESPCQKATQVKSGLSTRFLLQHALEMEQVAHEMTLRLRGPLSDEESDTARQQCQAAAAGIRAWDAACERIRILRG